MALFLCFREDEHHLIAQYCSSLNGDPSAQAVSPPTSLCSHASHHVCVVPMYVLYWCVSMKKPHADHACVVLLSLKTSNVDHHGCVVPVCFSQCSMQIMMAVFYRCVSVEKPDADHDGCVVPVCFS